jgi:hypothetical protein
MVHQARQRILMHQLLSLINPKAFVGSLTLVIRVKFDRFITLFEFGLRFLVDVAVDCTGVLNLLFVLLHEVEIDDRVSHTNVLDG